jgi:hypothetical protein
MYCAAEVVSSEKGAAAVAATQPWGYGSAYTSGYNSYGSYNAAAYCTPGTYYMDAGGLVQLCR